MRDLPFTPVEANEIWQFPMHYPLKVIGEASDLFVAEVTAIVLAQFNGFDLANLSVIPSRTGKYHAIRLNLYFNNADELNALYNALHNCKLIKTVL